MTATLGTDAETVIGGWLRCWCCSLIRQVLCRRLPPRAVTEPKLGVIICGDAKAALMQELRGFSSCLGLPDVPQSAARVEDKQLLKLIRAFLNAGVMENGLVSPSVEGPRKGDRFLSNLVLDELDRELEHRGHRFVRHADDCNIYVRSEQSGQRVMASITRFITQKLKLKVNEAKSAVAAGAQVPRVQLYTWSRRQAHHCAQISGAVQAPNPGDNAKGQGRQHQDDNGRELASYMRGRRGYFGFCETPEVLIALTR